jgi:N-acetylglucosaminyldiphosphoundecaprenol N-acetyl-beta-D-mannosaminyltransferase
MTDVLSRTPVAEGAGNPGPERNRGGDSARRVEILGVQVDDLDVPTLNRRVERIVLGKQHALVLHVNAHCLNLAYDHSWLRAQLNDAALVVCDGAGVVLASRILGDRLPPRIVLTDWIWELAALASRQRFTMFLLGGRPGVAAAAGRQLHRRFPSLRIVGVEHGHFAKVGPPSEAVIERINALRPAVLVVAFGMPAQERWLRENWAKIDADVGLTGGAVLDYCAGRVARGPSWMTNHGLEWLARLAIEPKRLWRRYLVGNALFIYRVLKQRLGLAGL